jgi:hypothetical protein
VRGFDPGFDDTAWTEAWLHVPLAQVPPGVYRDGFRIERRLIEYAEVFGRAYRLRAPLDCRFLYDPRGKLWMSSTPQEHIMMYNDGTRSRGHVLVGGLGLGMYPQYAQVGAAGEATRFTIIERSLAVRHMVEPTLTAALDVPLRVRTGDVEDLLAGPVTTRYDTILLDTWETLDAVLLPKINRLRDLAVRHLAPGGRVLLWGYGWMVRLFEDACRALLAIAPSDRPAWLQHRTRGAPAASELLRPVVERFDNAVVGDISQALRWCREHVVRVTPQASA